MTEALALHEVWTYEERKERIKSDGSKSVETKVGISGFVKPKRTTLFHHKGQLFMLIMLPASCIRSHPARLAWLIMLPLQL